MTTSMPSNTHDDIEFEIAKVNEHATSKRYRDRNKNSLSKKNADKKERKRTRGFLGEDSDEYYDEWD